MSWTADNSAEAVTPSSPALLAEEDELFVFGYECKIFRDDEKAEWIDKEKHLIPWMGDSNVLIDRYDGRGALMDLRNEDGVVDDEDDEMEKICEEERYRDLCEDEEYDESAYQEEEFRRLQLAVSGMSVPKSSHVTGQEEKTNNFSAIGYLYDANNGLSIGPEPRKLTEECPYTKPDGLYIPPDIKLPTTMKSHAKIEKTAKFIAEQGNQMEIILKTKQATNPQFDFLGYNDSLNPYYKYLVLAIKSGDYKPADLPSEEQNDSPSQKSDCSDSDEDFATSYLHPSLVKKDSTSAPASSIIYKSTTTNNAYSILVSKIKGSEPQEQQKLHASTESPVVPKEEISDTSRTYVSTIGGIPARQPHEMPSSQDQLIIEKMANYVVKNGSAFEGLAKTKGDPRFTFLDPQHEFHWYYLNCKERFKAEHNAVVASGNFMSYAKSEVKKSPPEIKSSNSTLGPGPGHTSTLPLSAAGIPIANHASIQSRPTTVSAELVSRIEEIRKKNALFNKSKDKLSSGSSASLPCDNSSSISSAFSLASATAQRILKRDSKEKPVIKFSSTLSHPSASRSDSKEKEDISSNSDSSKSSKSQSSKSSSTHEKSSRCSSDKVKNSDTNGREKIQATDKKEEEDQKRKEERRRKAALFLQRIKNTIENETVKVEVLNKDNTEGCHSDVESVPSPTLVQHDIEETCKENEPAPDSSLGHLLCSKLENEVQDRLKPPTDHSDGRNNIRCSSSPEKHRRSKRSLSSSSLESSYSDIHHTSSSSSSSKKKRSKRKHSKKRKKKHDRGREKSRSHSKKSKRRRH